MNCKQWILIITKPTLNGMADSLYKQAIPLANPTKMSGEWQTYDVIWTAPVLILMKV